MDGAFAFECSINVVAKFRLRTGLALTEDQIREIQLGEAKQECFDAAAVLLESRMHSTAEMRRKLMRKEYGQTIVEAVLNDLTRMGYLNDEQFAKAKAASAAERKQHGRRRAKAELMRAGVKSDVADKALDQVYDATDTLSVARELALKQQARLRKLEPQVARRRLIGMLQRRGFDYDDIKPVVEEVLGRGGRQESDRLGG